MVVINKSKIISIARETDHLREIQQKEESKTQSYKGLSATLQIITNTAGGVVAPQITRSLRAQTDCKNQIEKNNAACQRMWSDAMNLFLEEVTKVVDTHVQSVLRSIRNEAEEAIQSVGATGKRKREDNVNDAKENQEAEVLQEKGDSRNPKRQKHSCENVGSIELLKEAETGEGSLIREMKLKIEDQARAIVKLAQENNELRTALARGLIHTPSTQRFPQVGNEVQRKRG
ncbi:hypothetical protein CVT26_001212 [Gymnopilus dilepis]|uniref:Uncharacterized protein n=1 Tax=Gymnopilus dilepis TaxID=231916 RepID=A0A409YUJ6_9AGAR|nr:hypothetical protein CVT26_001212 [Gymnopilus dilepis]